MQPADDAVTRTVRASSAALIRLAAHELVNRLAVMRETVGLLDDLAMAGKSAADGTAKALAALDDQIGRALNIARSVSGVGAALEAGKDGFHAGAAVGGLFGLAERWARQRSLGLELDVAPDLPESGGDPALFLCLFHRLLERCSAGMRPGGTIVVRVRRSGPQVRVEVRPKEPPAGEAAAESGDDGTDRALAGRLGAGLTFKKGGVATIVLAAAR